MPAPGLSVDACSAGCGGAAVAGVGAGELEVQAAPGLTKYCCKPFGAEALAPDDPLASFCCSRHRLFDSAFCSRRLTAAVSIGRLDSCWTSISSPSDEVPRSDSFVP